MCIRHVARGAVLMLSDRITEPVIDPIRSHNNDVVGHF